MKTLPLNALRAFAFVYETGGVRPAARALNIAHSSVSRHVRELEGWLGVDLLESGKSSRPLRFTGHGEILGKAALKSLRDLETAISSVREKRRGNAVTLMTTPSFAARWLLPRLHDFNARFPWIEISVTADQKLTDPAESGADIGIRMGKGPWKGFHCEPLMDDALFPVMSPTLWQNSGRPREPGNLAGLKLLHDRDPNTSWDKWRRCHDVKGVDFSAGPRFASSDLVLRAAAQGLGVALARRRLAADDLALGVLVRPFGDHCLDLPNAYWIVREETEEAGIAVSHALQWLRDQAAKPEASGLGPDGIVGPETWKALGPLEE